MDIIEIQHSMIPPEIKNYIFPQVADGTSNPVVLQHVCGVDFQFEFNEYGGDQYVITDRHLHSWQVSLDELAETAGENCFSYNTLDADPSGVYHDRDGNTFAILFAPGTFLEHNGVDGAPLLLVISEAECILTGTKSEAGKKLIQEQLLKSLATKVVTIDSEWRKWIEASAI